MPTGFGVQRQIFAFIPIICPVFDPASHAQKALKPLAAKGCGKF
jgi:hypothetical protein